jgi:hypothetical protein
MKAPFVTVFVLDAERKECALNLIVSIIACFKSHFIQFGIVTWDVE